MKAMSRFMLGFFLMGLLSCQAASINPGSERLRVFEAEPKGCIFVGEIPSVQETTVKGEHLNDVDMDLDTRVDLRNKAHALGGNVIVFKNMKDAKKTAAADLKKTTPAPGDAATAAAEEEKKIKAVFLATVFRCPASIVNQ